MIKNPASTRVVVTGGVVSPIGNDFNAFADNLLSGISGAAPITLFDAEKFPTRFAREVKISILQILLTQSCPSEWIVLRI